MAKDNTGKTYTKTAVRVTQELVDHAIATFVEKYNQHNPGSHIDSRMSPGKSAQRQEDGAHQFSLTLEVKVDGLWEVLLRTTAWAIPTSQEDVALLTTELYRSMFVEIMHTGLLTSLVQTTQQNGTQETFNPSKARSHTAALDFGYGQTDQSIN